MRNAETTKNKILSMAASLFNTQGFKATSLRDITLATGFTKGAIYRHFRDKENLEESTYDFISQKMQEKLRDTIKSKHTAPDKLLAICAFFRTNIHAPIITGGCPILNAGVEADDTKPGLNLKVKQLLDLFQNSMIHIINKGIEHGQIKKETKAETFAVIFIASLEGGILISKIRKRSVDFEYIIQELQAKVESIKV